MNLEPNRLKGVKRQTVSRRGLVSGFQSKEDHIFWGGGGDLFCVMALWRTGLLFCVTTFCSCLGERPLPRCHFTHLR